MKLVLGFVLVAALAPAAAATCAYIEQVDVLISGSGAIAADGAVLVGHGSRPPGGKHLPRAEDWKAVDGNGKPAEVKLVELAPGIRAFVRTSPATAKSKLVIQDTAGVIGAFTYEEMKLALPPPVASNAKVTWSTGFRGSPRSTFQVDVASVRDDAAYLVVTGPGSSSAVGAPHSQTGKATLIPYAAGGHCDFGSPGTVPGDGEAITLVWMDRYGRKGPASKQVKATSRR